MNEDYGREKITQKYLFMALEELSKHKGSIKRGRALERAWQREILAYEDNKPKVKLNIRKK